MPGIENLFQLSVDYADKIKKISSPLCNSFGVEYLWCSKTFEDGRFLCVSNNLELHEFYYSTNSHISNPFYRNPELIHPGLYFHQDYHTNSQYQSVMSLFSEKFNVRFCTNVLVKRSKELIRIGYATKTSHSRHFNSIISNNFYLINKFNEFFIEEINSIFLVGENYSVDLKKELGELYYKPLQLFTNLEADKKIHFLEQIGLINKECILELSNREIKCMYYIAEGYTTPKIARALYISPRTAEHYIESIKNKLRYDTKFELFQIATILKNSGLLP